MSDERLTELRFDGTTRVLPLPCPSVCNRVDRALYYPLGCMKSGEKFWCKTHDEPWADTREGPDE